MGSLMGIAGANFATRFRAQALGLIRKKTPTLVELQHFWGREFDVGG